jgi:hypothetical protein
MQLVVRALIQVVNTSKHYFYIFIFRDGRGTETLPELENSCEAAFSHPYFWESLL